MAEEDAAAGNDLQKAIVTALKAATDFQRFAGGRIFDGLRKEGPFPYVSFGPSDELQDDATCIDGVDVTLQLDVWSRKVGFVEARLVAKAVKRALHDRDLPLTENALVLIEHQQTRYFRDPDGLTSHAAMTFLAVIEEAA